MGYLPWYCEGTREGRPLRACLILRASFHSIAGGAKKDRIISQLRVIFTSVSTSQYLPHSLLRTLSGITGLLQDNMCFWLRRKAQMRHTFASTWKVLWTLMLEMFGRKYWTENGTTNSYLSVAPVSSCSSNTDQAHNTTAAFTLKTKE